MSFGFSIIDNVQKLFTRKSETQLSMQFPDTNDWKKLFTDYYLKISETGISAIFPLAFFNDCFENNFQFHGF